MGLRLVLAFSDLGTCRPWLEALRADGIAVHLLPRGAPLAARVDALARVAAAENAKLLHTHYTRWDVPAAVVGAWRGIPVVWHLHSPLPPLRGVRLLATTAIKFRVLARRAHVAAVSKAIWLEAIRRGCPARHASYVPNSIDLFHATHASAGRDEIRRDLALSPSARVALAFGWDPARKGIDVALSAAEALATSGREIVLVLVGAEALEAFVAERIGPSLPEWLRILPPRERVGDLYAAADVFLSPSRAEGFPYALGEALANGLPSVTSDIPGVEWARGLDAAAFFPSGDAGALADAITDLLERSPDRRAASAAEARAFAAAHLSLGAWAERVIAVYRAALGERGVGRAEPDLQEGPNEASPRVASQR
jgi:glycosyltransferase involved in cell wall biosynthesis